MAEETVGIVGGGIVGLAIARELMRRRPGVEMVLLEKEDRLAAHQTGRNSGVVHAGLYYKPGSLKAELCTRGRALLREFCAEHRLPYDENEHGQRSRSRRSSRATKSTWARYRKACGCVSTPRRCSWGWASSSSRRG